MKDKSIKKSVDVLINGGIVIFPTDTAYGIGCRIDDERAVRRLFEIRKRPPTQATPVLVDSIDMAQKYLLPVPLEVKEKLMKKYWPGALTIILPCIANKIPRLVRGSGVTLGVRIPDFQITREIIREVGVPILGPSANFHGEKTPFKFEDLNPALVSLVDYVLEYKLKLGKNVSTVIDCKYKQWKIIRQGAVKLKV